MPWTTPVDRAAGYVVTNTDWNNNLGASGDTAYLYGDTSWSGSGTVTFSNSWVDFGGTSPFGYRKIGSRVFFRGAIKSGTVNATATAVTMPSGYRPTQNLNFAIASNSLFGMVGVTSAGLLTVVVGSNVWASLDNVNYDTI